MIRTPCAWARGELRRNFTTDFAARNGLHSHSGTSISVQMNSARARITHANIQTTRCHTTKPPKVPEPSQTIPGPSWLWLEPIYEPFRAYGRVQQRKPYMTQFISSLVIYFVGDLVAQGIAGDAAVPVEGNVVVGEGSSDADEKGWVQQWSDNRDWSRTGRAIIIGGLSSIPSYKWFLWLGNNFNYGSKILSLSTKVVVNQALFTPLFNSYFFGMQSLLSGASLSDCAERIKNTVPTSWINSCKLWPIVTAFSFTYIPIQYRSIFGGVIAIGWQTYLSLLNQRAAALEGGHTDDVVETKKVQRVVEVREEKEQGGREKCAA
ncbi:hypothetical protein NX059_003336 [Plenodomus lindquistii]|nr:hypothetical protein NX059_003336 [Plenodomus lindquistii]